MAETLSIQVSYKCQGLDSKEVKNGKYLTYPKIDREQTWNFYLILSIFVFKCKILDQNAIINDRDIINTSVKV